MKNVNERYFNQVILFKSYCYATHQVKSYIDIELLKILVHKKKKNNFLVTPCFLGQAYKIGTSIIYIKYRTELNVKTINMQLGKIHVFNYSTLTSRMLVFIYLLVYLIVAWVDFQRLTKHKENRTFDETGKTHLNKILINRTRDQFV